MKKLLLVATLVLFMAGNVFAAGTLTATSDVVYTGPTGKAETRFITIAVVWDASAGAPANTALQDISGIRFKIHGWWLQCIDWNYGATGPKDDTGLYLWRVEDRVDVLGGEGANAIDNATVSTIFPATQTRILDGNELLDLDGNDVNNATGTLIFELYR